MCVPLVIEYSAWIYGVVWYTTKARPHPHNEEMVLFFWVKGEDMIFFFSSTKWRNGLLKKIPLNGQGPNEKKSSWNHLKQVWQKKNASKAQLKLGGSLALQITSRRNRVRSLGVSNPKMPPSLADMTKKINKKTTQTTEKWLHALTQQYPYK